MTSSATTTLLDAPPIGTVDRDLDGLDRTQARLTELADLAHATDQLVARMVVLLAELHDTPDVEVPLPAWLGQVARRTSGDVRMLQTAADVLPTMPATFTAFRDGRLSWAQVRAIVSATRRLSRADRADIDHHLAGILDQARTWMPDDLVALVDDHVTRLRPDRLEQAEDTAEQSEFLALTPNLFGGGKIYSELGTESFTTVAEALDPPAQQVHQTARAGEPVWKTRSRARAHRLVSLCDRALAGTTRNHTDGGDDGTDGGARRARPMALLTVGLDAVLDRNQTPGWLLHTLTGGRMWVSSPLARRLIDQRGTDLRTIILDDTGTAVGVGHKTNVPPGWLRETIWAMYGRDVAPGSNTAVRLCDLDHDLPWDDAGTGGPTDVDTLQPIGRQVHNGKTHGHWQVTNNHDGTRTWKHTTGLTTTIPRPRRRLTDPPGDPPDG